MKIMKTFNYPDITKHLQDEIYSTDKEIILPNGNFIISKTIFLTNNTKISGSNKNKTILHLKEGTNNNMFTNESHIVGNSNIVISNIKVIGNAKKQEKPKHEKKLSFCNFIYLRNVTKFELIDVYVFDFKQTALHFNNCFNIRITNLYAKKLGWSGISTSNTSDIVAKKITIIDSGRDIIHSAVHFDGGENILIDANIDICVGNGIMLDSKYSKLNKANIKANCKSCKRGISLSGAHENKLSNVLIKQSNIENSEVGIMVSNSENVFIDKVNIVNCSEFGILFQGKFGGNNTMVSNSIFTNNKKDIIEIHSSKNNYFIDNNIDFRSKSSLEIEKTKSKTSILNDSYHGICEVCGHKTSFQYYGGSVRESFICKHCKSSLRHRGIAKAIIDEYSHNEVNCFAELALNNYFHNINIYEPGIIGPLRKYFKDFQNYKKSYYFEELELGVINDGVENQDLQKLTFDNEKFDLIITADIFEHIRKPYDAFKEIHRVLKKGGKHIFSIPVQFPMPKETVYRIDTSSDIDNYILPKKYHIAGNGEKSIVYNEFGKDMLKRLKEIGLDTWYVFINEKNINTKKNITFISKKL